MEFSFEDVYIALNHQKMETAKISRMSEALLSLLFYACMHFIFTGCTNTKPAVQSQESNAAVQSDPSMTIEWKYGNAAPFAYIIRPIEGDSVEVHLVYQAKEISVRKMEWNGGFEALVKDTKASFSRLQKQIEGKSVRAAKYALILSSRIGSKEETLRAYASHNMFLDAFYADPHLDVLLTQISLNQPKMYRIVDKYSTNKAHILLEPRVK